MADPKVILWTSVKRLGYMTILQIKGMVLKWNRINYGVINYVKNSYLFDKFVIELVEQ